MSRSLLSRLRYIIATVALLFMGISSYANHLVGADLKYDWVAGNTYKITLILYGDCGSAAAGSPFPYLPCNRPHVCVFNGSTSVADIELTLVPSQSDIEITPVCPDSVGRTQCTVPSSATPGIKKYVYTFNYTVPGPSHTWRFIYNGYNPPATPWTCPGGPLTVTAGRATTITNLLSPGTIHLIDTLDNFSAPNTSPLLTSDPTPFYPLGYATSYTPGAVDIDGDSLMYDLVAASNGTSGATTCSDASTFPGYTGTAWGAVPISATNPLTVTAGSWDFDPFTGLILFEPSVLQRSVVVYNVREFRSNVFVGSSQREMTFKILPATNPPPHMGAITVGGVITAEDSLHYHVCGDAGTFSLDIDPTPADPTNEVVITISGLPAVMGAVVTNNNTNSPHIHITGDASTMNPGLYTFFLKMTDNSCPARGVSLRAFSIRIYPVPTIHHTLVAAANCLENAVIQVVPGGTGDPWTIKVRDSSMTLTGTPPTLDTIQTFTSSVPFNDTLGAGTYYLHIFTNVSTECSLVDTVRLPKVLPFLPTATHTDPTYCGSNNGKIVISNLNPGGVDTVIYNYTTIAAGTITVTVSQIVAADGTITLNNLYAGDYSNIIVQYGFCTAAPIGPLRLANPPFTWRTMTYQNPSKCGFCDGFIRLVGLHPGQLDTIKYFSPTHAIATSYFIGPDSSVIISGLCDSAYSNFVATTAGEGCVTTPLGPAPLVAPGINADFTFEKHPGCKGDTVLFTNNSVPVSDLHYTWFFGDILTSTEVNPVHVYTNTLNQSYTVKLFATNSKCLDSSIATFVLDHAVKADFTMVPAEFVCQKDTVTFTNTSAGSTPDFTWSFGDAMTSNSAATEIKHPYTSPDSYTITLVAHSMKDGINCYDTARKVITVDSNTVFGMSATSDLTALCRGQAITFKGDFASNSGNTALIWQFTDGLNINNVNPVLHGFEAAGDYTINLKGEFRACPDKAAARTIKIVDLPNIYLGPDTVMCPTSSPVTLTDIRNINNPKATWEWNTGEKGPQIRATRPDIYTATVTIDGCSSTDSVLIQRDCYMDMPNVFTPNGDGINDYFFPRRFLTRGVTEFSMMIYNRWGQPIYETKITDGQGWDGKFNNVPQPAGVYVYMIDATFKDGQVEHHQGNVTLLK